MSTYLELKAQAEELMRKAEEARKKELEGVIADIKEKIAEYGITAKDLGLSVDKATTRQAGSSAPAPVRYRHPDGRTWSGKGRAPNWIKEAEEAGKNREDFSV